jgi:hypothetical protein
MFVVGDRGADCISIPRIRTLLRLRESFKEVSHLQRFRA